MKSSLRRPCLLRCFSLYSLYMFTSTSICSSDFVSHQPYPHSLSSSKLTVHSAYWASSETPFINVLSSDPQFQSSLKKIQDHIAFIERQTISSLSSPQIPTNSDTSSRKHKPPTLQPCLFTDGWRFPHGVIKRFLNLNLGEPEITCITQFEGIHTGMTSDDANNEIPSPVPPHSVAELYDAVVTRASTLYALRFNITSAAGVDWPLADVLYRFPYNQTLRKCLVHPVSALRVNSNTSDTGGKQWYTDMRVSEQPMLHYLPKLQRRFLSEHVHVVSNTDGNTEMKPLTLHNIKDIEGEKTQNSATTVIIDRPEVVTPSNYDVMRVEENPAIKASLSMSDISVQQVQDALAPSSIAILFLPLALTIVPIAAVAPVSTTSMFLYTLVSDVLAVVPLAIKGVELIIIGFQRHRSIVVRITSTIDGTFAEKAGAELFAAECRAREYVKPAGIRFLAIALGFMVVGIWLEFLALGIRRRRLASRKALDDKYGSLLGEKQEHYEIE